MAHVLVDAYPAGGERNATENAQRLALTVTKWILPFASHVIKRTLGVGANITVAYTVSFREMNKSVKKKTDVVYSAVNPLSGAMLAQIAVVMAAMVRFVIRQMVFAFINARIISMEKLAITSAAPTVRFYRAIR